MKWGAGWFRLVFTLLTLTVTWVLCKPTHTKSLRHMSNIDRVKKYFEVWNAHDVEGITSLHASTSSLKDWDAAHGPTNKEVAAGIAGIWKAVPAIKIEIVDVYTLNEDLTCVANIKVVVDEKTTLKVCDVITFDAQGLVSSIVAYKAD